MPAFCSKLCGHDCQPHAKERSLQVCELIREYYSEEKQGGRCLAESYQSCSEYKVFRLLTQVDGVQDRLS